MQREHLNISACPVLFFKFLVKFVFDLIANEALITRLTKRRIALNNLQLLIVCICVVSGA